MHIDVAINNLVKEFKHDKKNFVLSRFFGLVFMIAISPFIGLFVRNEKTRLWLDSHPLMNGLVELCIVTFVISSIAIKIDTGQVKKITLIPFGISLLLLGAIGWMVLI